MELAAQDEPGAQPGADREEDEVLDAARDARPVLAEGGEVDVVLEGDRETRAARRASPREVAALEAGDVRRQLDAAGRRVDDAGTPTTAPSRSCVGRARRRRPATPRSARSRRAPLRPRARQLDVLARANRPGEVADRTAQEPCAEVEAERRAPPPAPARRRRRRSVGPPGSSSASRTSPASSSDWSARETVGFEMPARREISRPRDRRARPDRLEHGPLVQMLEQGWNGGRAGRISVKNINSTKPLIPSYLTSRRCGRVIRFARSEP